jgi:hypothetical protein
MNERIRKHADNLYQKAASELNQKRQSAVMTHIDEMSRRGMAHGFNGIAYSGRIRIEADTIGDDLMARLTSFQEAFAEASSVPLTDDLNDIWQMIQEHYERSIQNGADLLRQYLAQQGEPNRNPTESLRSATPHHHGKVLHEFNVWRSRVQLPSSPKQMPDADTKQTFFPAGSEHDAFAEVRSIIILATTELTIVDSYVDDTLFPLFTNIGNSVTIKILTQNMKGDFLLERLKFAAQHGRSIEVRQSSSNHDRFIIVDGECWHCGASIKDAGAKGFMLSKVQADEAPRVVAQIARDWANANIVL